MKLSDFFGQDYHVQLIKNLQSNKKLTLSGIGNPTAKSFLVYHFIKNTNQKILWVCQDESEVLEISKDLPLWLPDSFSILKDHHSEKVVIDQVIKFRDVNNTQLNILIIDNTLLEKPFPSITSLEKASLNIQLKDKISIVELLNKLIIQGYEHSDEVFLPIGTFRRSGDLIEIHPLGFNQVYKIEIEFDEILAIHEYDPIKRKIIKNTNSLPFLPCKYPAEPRNILNILNNDNILLIDELENLSEKNEEYIEKADFFKLKFTSFPRDDEIYEHLRYLSVLKFYSLPDFLTDLRNKISLQWNIIIFTKRKTELINIFQEEHIPYSCENKDSLTVKILEAPISDYVPMSFQNPNEKLAFITDKEIFSLQKSSRNQSISKMSINFIASLKPGDYVVHFDHGIGIFIGITQRSVENNVREYLEIHFEDNDVLFVPIDQADKVSKYIVDEGTEVKLNKLGKNEWQKQVKKAKQETEQMAKELLKLYAKRAGTKRNGFTNNATREHEFAKTFPYEETPGQMAAIRDINKDMESSEPMDRLICGDVGFGKTEIAMRAAFKAVENGKQVALVSPVTILAEQHFYSFKKRMDAFGIRIEMLSRFKTPGEQKVIINNVRKGNIDIVIGTHRLLQKDIEFLNLGLVIIDEEQRFGVEQKEILKKLRAQVDILTLTATPIPRTLNLSLNKLRDITTITTPPPGRLPIITEIRKFSDNLIRDVILKELKREGQVYFLHNRVETIESIAEKLRILVPEAKFTVAHGQMGAKMLESRIMAFKKKEFDILISSTIIENGIDLPNANTMIINNAEKFGLSQLYQLRGRIGRSKTQAYAYLLYHTQKLNFDAKKRLRALIEASELGSGFQIAMRDLEIRGAGEILGSSQHGTMKTIGVSNFLKLLQKTIKEMQSNPDNLETGEDEEDFNVGIEIPIEAFIPNEYITDSKEKISVYQKLASVKEINLLEEFYNDIKDEYGEMPRQVKNLFKVLELKIYANKAHISKVRTNNLFNNTKEIELLLGKKCKPALIVKIIDKNKHWLITGESLKIDIKNLGELWLKELIENIKAMTE